MTGTLGCSDVGHLAEVGKKEGVWVLTDKKLQTGWCLVLRKLVCPKLRGKR